MDSSYRAEMSLLPRLFDSVQTMARRGSRSHKSALRIYFNPHLAVNRHMTTAQNRFAPGYHVKNPCTCTT